MTTAKGSGSRIEATDALLDPPVTAVLDVRVKPGSEADFERGMAALIQVARTYPGHLGSTVIRPVNNSLPYRFIYKFDRRFHLLTWHGSEDRQRLFAAVLPTVESTGTQEMPGLESWLSLPGDAALPAPPKWKTTLVSWLAIYPVALALSSLLRYFHLHEILHPSLYVLVLTAGVVPTVAYIVAPRLSRLLHHWLHAERGN
jgi:antibiotic biosynthesis monooxygenase (ABM) superfamily enzyme